jgi:PAB-dependent poly(A)-specific ribonuclease subunit 3
MEERFLAEPLGYLAEDVLWSFTAQLLSALRSIHQAGLACRVIHPSKILITGKNRYV